MSNTAWYEELKVLHKKPVKIWYRFVIVVKCPACDAVMGEIKSRDGTYGMWFALLVDDARESHLEISPDCAKHQYWEFGCRTETIEIKQ